MNEIYLPAVWCSSLPNQHLSHAVLITIIFICSVFIWTCDCRRAKQSLCVWIYSAFAGLLSWKCWYLNTLLHCCLEVPTTCVCIIYYNILFYIFLFFIFWIYCTEFHFSASFYSILVFISFIILLLILLQHLSGFAILYQTWQPGFFLRFSYIFYELCVPAPVMFELFSLSSEIAYKYNINTEKRQLKCCMKHTFSVRQWFLVEY